MSLLLRTWDIETTNWNQFVIACLYDGKDSYYCYNVKDVIKTMIKLKGTFYAHFAGGFDNLFLLEELKNYRCTIQNIKGRLVKIGVYYKNSKKKLFELRDSFPILPSSLAKLQDSFDIDICISQEKWHEYKARRNEIESFTKEELEEYVKVDTVVLYDILQEAKEIFEVEDFKMTIASETYSKFCETYDIKSLYLPSRFDSYFRESYSGGRVEVFKRKGHDLKHYDFKSMYPTVMDRYEYPSGLAVYTASLKKGKFGIYTVDIDCPHMKIPFLHAYDKDGKLIFPTGKWSGTYTSVEIEKALSLGYKINVKAGYYFTKKCRPFKEYIAKYYALKLRAEKEGKSALRFIAKLYLNSLYGKFGQKRKFNKVKPITGSLREMIQKFNVKEVMEDMGMVVVEEEARKPYTLTHIASFVTAYSRIMLYEAFEEAMAKGGDVYYCDTDSLVTNVEMSIGKNLGDLDLESEIKDGYFLFPKFYGYTHTDGRETIRTKGLSADFKVKDFKKAFYEDTYEQFNDETESIIGLLEGHRRHRNYLDVLKRTRRVSGKFTKRIIDVDGIQTHPITVENL